MTIWYAVEDNVATRCGRPCYTRIRSCIRPIDPCRHIIRVGVWTPSKGAFVVVLSFHIFITKLCSFWWQYGMPWKTTLRPVVDVLVIQESVVVSVLSIDPCRHIIRGGPPEPPNDAFVLVPWFHIFTTKLCSFWWRYGMLWKTMLQGIRIGTRPIDPCRHIVRVGVAAPSRGPFVVAPSFRIFKQKIYCSWWWYGLL